MKVGIFGKLRITERFFPPRERKITWNKRNFELLPVRITDGYLQEFIKEK